MRGAFLLLFLVTGAWANDWVPGLPKRLTIPAGTEIEVQKYIRESDTFKIKMIEEDSVGPNITTPEWLREALGSDKKGSEFVEKIQKNPTEIYTISKPLPLLWDKEVAIRIKKFK